MNWLARMEGHRTMFIGQFRSYPNFREALASCAATYIC
jgi:hypothetical protein